jgi:hypothetical protein
MTGEIADGGEAAHLSMTAAGVDVEVTVVDGVVYTETAGQCFQQEVPEGDVPEGQTGFTDPGPLLDMLGGVGDGVTDEGTEEVRGVETTHFAGSFTMRDALEEVPEDQRASVEALFGSGQLGGDLLDTEIPVDVFVDDDGLVRRMEMVMDFGALGGVDVPALTMAMDLFDFGADISVAPPTGCDETLPTLPDIGSGDLGFDEGELQEFCEDALEGFEADLPEGVDPCADLGEPTG